MGKAMKQSKKGLARRARALTRALFRRATAPFLCLMSSHRNKMLAKEANRIIARHARHPTKPCGTSVISLEAAAGTQLTAEVAPLAVEGRAPLLLTSPDHQLTLEIVTETPTALVTISVAKDCRLAITYPTPLAPAASVQQPALLLTYYGYGYKTTVSNIKAAIFVHAEPIIIAAPVACIAAAAPAAAVVTSQQMPLLLTDYSHWERHQACVPPINEFFAACASAKDLLRGMGLTTAPAARVSAPAVSIKVQLDPSLTFSGFGLKKTKVPFLMGANLVPGAIFRGVAARRAAGAVARVAPRTAIMAPAIAVPVPRKAACTARLRSLQLEMLRAVTAPPRHPLPRPVRKLDPVEVAFLEASCKQLVTSMIKDVCKDLYETAADVAPVPDAAPAAITAVDDSATANTANAAPAPDSFRFPYNSIDCLPPGLYRIGQLTAADKARWEVVGFNCTVDEALNGDEALSPQLQVALDAAKVSAVAIRRKMRDVQRSARWTYNPALYPFKRLINALEKLTLSRDFIERAAVADAVECERLSLPRRPVPLPLWAIQTAMKAMLVGREAIDDAFTSLCKNRRYMTRTDGHRLGNAVRVAFRQVQVLHAALPVSHTECMPGEYASKACHADEWIVSVIYCPGKECHVPYALKVTGPVLVGDGIDLRYPEFYGLDLTGDDSDGGTSGQETPRSDEGSVLPDAAPPADGPAGDAPRDDSSNDDDVCGDDSCGKEAPVLKKKGVRGKRGSGKNKAAAEKKSRDLVKQHKQRVQQAQQAQPQAEEAEAWAQQQAQQEAFAAQQQAWATQQAHHEAWAAQQPWAQPQPWAAQHAHHQAWAQQQAHHQAWAAQQAQQEAHAQMQAQWEEWAMLYGAQTADQLYHQYLHGQQGGQW